MKKGLVKRLPLLIPLGLCFLVLGFFLTPRTLMPPSRVDEVFWVAGPSQTGSSTAPETLERVKAAMADTTLTPVGLPLPEGFYGRAITFVSPEVSELYFVTLRSLDNRVISGFAIDELGQIYKNHVIYNYTCGGEELLDLLRDDSLWTGMTVLYPN